MEKIKINGKALYSTKGAAREYGRIGCNFYVGCPHGCTYCYLKRGAPSKQLGESEVKLKKCFEDETDALMALSAESLKYKNYLKETGVFFSFTTDPMIEETRRLTFSAIGILCETDIPVKVLTKAAGWWSEQRELRFLDYLGAYHSDKVQFGWTLTGHDEMEPNASRNVDRIEEMRRIKEFGLRTFASIEPVIDWNAAQMMVDVSIPYCDHYKIGLRSGVKKDYYDDVQSYSAIENIVRRIEAEGKTVYLKESVRRLLQRVLQPGAYEAFLSHTVDMDGKKINI